MMKQKIKAIKKNSPMIQESKQSKKTANSPLEEASEQFRISQLVHYTDFSQNN